MVKEEDLTKNHVSKYICSDVHFALSIGIPLHEVYVAGLIFALGRAPLT